MKRVLSALAGGTVLATSALLAPTAQAAGITVTSPSCGELRAANATTGSVDFFTDGGIGNTIAAGRSYGETMLPSGEYVWQATNASGTLLAKGSTTVRGCSGTPPRPAEGDQDGDSRADVLGVKAGTGELFYYRMGSVGLASGVKVGTGWNSTIALHQVKEIDGIESDDVVLAIRSDGTAWYYDNTTGPGRLTNGRKVASGLSGYTNFTVLPLNSSLLMGGHALLASKGDVLYAFPMDSTGIDTTARIQLATGWSSVTKTIAMRNFDTDHFANVLTIRSNGDMYAHRIAFDQDSATFFSSARQVGHGWGAMGIVSSQGSLDGDRLGDLVARRNDGNLYKYLNAGGSWKPGAKIGANWQGIRLLG